MAQPTLPTWADGDPSYVIEPGSAKKTVGWLSGEKPPYQYMNWIHNATSTYLTYLEDKILSNAPAMVRSSSAASWNGSTLTLTDPLDISFRVEDGEQLNRLAAGSYAFSDGQVLVVKKDLTNASPVTLGSGSYGSLAEGDYVIVTETSLTGDDWENETIVLRRKGSDLENVLSGEIYESGASIDWGKTSLTNASINDASNTSVTRVFSATHTTTGTAAAGIGTEIALLAENGAGTSVLTASLQGAFSDVTNGSEDSYADLYITVAGASVRNSRFEDGLLTLKGAAGSGTLQLGDASTNTISQVRFIGSSTQKNWLIGANSNFAGGLEFTPSTATGGQTFTTPSFFIDSSENIGIRATKKFYIDGGGDTWIDEISANNMRFVAGGTELFRVEPSGVQVQGYIVMPATSKFYLDGGGDTYLYEVSANVLSAFTGGTERLRINASGDVGVATSGPDAKLDVLSTTEQIRQTYTDGSVYASHLVNSSGYYSVIATGSRYGFGTSSPATSLHLMVGGTAATSGIRLQADSGIVPFIQFTDGTHAFVPYYDPSSNEFRINYDATLGTATLTALKLNSSGEMLLPDVDTPTANYGNRNGFLKGFINLDTSTNTDNGSYNVSSLTDEAAGQVTINWDTDQISSAQNISIATPFYSTTLNNATIQIVATAAGTTKIARYQAGALSDGQAFIALCGRQ